MGDFMLIDTHAHLNFKAFRKNLDNVLWEASQKGVDKIIVPGADWDSSKKAVTLAKSYKNIYAAVGIHPHHIFEVKSEKLKFKNELKKLALNNKVVAIGECGLDYFQYEKTKYKDYKVDANFKKKQKEVFALQLKIAQELSLPVILHCRQAHKDMKKIISSKFKNLKRGVFHCFSGDEKFLRWVIKKGFYVGFDGNLTYDKNLVKIATLTPFDKIILETDSPFLIPEPLRSKKIFPNRPENVTIIARFLAKIRNVSFGRVASQTTANAKKLFKL